MATGNIQKIKTADIYDDTQQKTQSELNYRLLTNSSGTAINLLSDYPETEVSMQADGMLYLRNDSGKNGSVMVHFSNTNNTMLLGGVQGYFILPIRKGMKLTCRNSPTTCLFYPFQY